MSNLFLLIENRNECPIEGFTILGLSTARDNEESIGQFGSGNKHGLNVCIRANITPRIFSGVREFQFYANPKVLNGKPYQQIAYRIDGGAEVELSQCTAFGEMDWDEIRMALREFISNAIDQGDTTIKTVVQSEVEPREGYTRIFVPGTPEVLKFYGELHNHFLNFDERVNDKVVKKFSESAEGERARIYYKGVFVRQMQNGKPSMFDYNLRTMKIDECRNMNEYSVRGYAAKELAKTENLETILRSQIDKHEETLWEHGFGRYDYGYSSENRIKSTWEKIAPGKIICAPGNIGMQIRKGLENQGFQCVTVPDKLYSVLDEAGCDIAEKFISKVETEGNEIVRKPKDAQETLENVWKVILSVKMNAGKKMPKLEVFRRIMKEGKQLCGYWDKNTPDTIFINEENVTCRQTILEECAHYITEATDNSRDFQDWAFKFAVAVAFDD